MKLKRPSKPKAVQPVTPRFDGLLRGLREFIAGSRRQVLRAVDVVQVRTCGGVGRHIVEFEQGGAGRAEYGAKLLPRLAEKLTEEFGRGFDASNLRYMRLFYIAFPNCDALRHELSPFQLICMARRGTFPISRRGASRIEVHAPANGIRQPHR